MFQLPVELSVVLFSAISTLVWGGFSLVIIKVIWSQYKDTQKPNYVLTELYFKRLVLVAVLFALLSLSLSLLSTVKPSSLNNKPVHNVSELASD